MTTAYFDSSAFVKLVVDEPGSDGARRLWNDVDAVVSSRLARPEVSAALSAARRARRISRVGEGLARADWDELWTATRVLELTPLVADVAASLSKAQVIGGADSVHLASALALREADPVLVTWDRRLRSAATEIGLAIAPAGV